MRKQTLDDLAPGTLKGKRVFVRVDYNVPVENGRVTDDTRIRASLPTLKHLVENGAALVLASHLGRPKAKWKPEFSLAPVADRLRELIDAPVSFVPDILGEQAQAAVAALKPGEILLLENVRFQAEEEANDPAFSAALARYGDLYVDDAFGTAHRAHATTEGVARVMKEAGKPAVAGYLIEKELRFLGQALSDPQRPFAAILGGAKISGKIDVIEKLLPQVDHLLIGGAMANTFFKAMGLETGKSLVEDDKIEMARGLLARAGTKLVLPVDCIVAAEATAGVATQVVERAAIPSDLAVYDVGPKSVAVFADILRGSRTILWNGPVGMFEVAAFASGTRSLADALAEAAAGGAVAVVGGGDTAAAVEEAGLAGRMTHVSTGGGASLEFLEGRVLPGVDVLDDAEVAA
ncbi:MAG: phosphoglycerate kinase [Gemmatimonadetes bacterium]|nr:phosphoglycerate kinase [Gemmatimonadota bacterium]